MESLKILLVDDEKSIRETLSIVLKDAGYKIFTADSGQEAIEIIKENYIDIMITDLKMPCMDGLELMNKTMEIDSTIEVIFISAYSDIKCAIKAVKMGAFDYIEKSFSSDELLLTIEKAAERRKLLEENTILRKQLNCDARNVGIVGKSKKIQAILSMSRRIANSKATVLITGESGVGKELFAKLIHKESPRRDKNFVVINCGAIPENLIESELFGHEKGSFTGAVYEKIGKFEKANGGTIFLDEVGELPLSLQVRFLRVLQEKKIERIGSLNSLDVDVRIIAATNRDLYEEVKTGNFRDDLYYRLNVVNIQIPSLRERKEDIPLLCDKFVDDFSKEYGKSIEIIDMEAIYALMKYPWKGNIRELKNAIEHAVVVANKNEKILMKKHLPRELYNSSSEESSEKILKLRDLEKIMIINTLKKNNGNKTKTAETLGIKRQTLYNKIKEYNLDY